MQDHPNGFIQAISSSAMSLVTVGVAFIGYWGFQGESAKKPWETQQIPVLVTMGLGIFLLSLVPVTSSISYFNKSVRYHFCAGAFLILFPIFYAIYQSIVLISNN